MKKLLLIVDYQNDFVASKGSLTAGKPAQAIEKNLVKKIMVCRSADEDVLCTLDTHPTGGWTGDQPEGARSPIHCAEGSEGWKLYGKLAGLNLETLTKSSYMLESTDIDWLVRQYSAIELAGVATDICVLQNAIGLYNHAANHGLSVAFSVSSDCVAALDPERQQFALDYMKDVLGFAVS